MNTAPADFNAATDLPAGFMDFLLPLHRALTPRRQELIERRAECLAAAHHGQKPDHPPPSEATTGDWRIELPDWCQDQRNQMTGPADDAELVVKMLNSGAPGVMLDLEDSMANYWPNLTRGVSNILQALRGALTYFDKKRDPTVAIKKSQTVIWSRARGLHFGQAGVIKNEVIAQRILHRDAVKIVDGNGRPVRHTPEFVSELFDEELNRILRELPADAPPEVIEKYRAARRVSEQMITSGEFDPI